MQILSGLRDSHRSKMGARRRSSHVRPNNNIWNPWTTARTAGSSDVNAKWTVGISRSTQVVFSFPPDPLTERSG